MRFVFGVRPPPPHPTQQPVLLSAADSAFVTVLKHTFSIKLSEGLNFHTYNKARPRRLTEQHYQIESLSLSLDEKTKATVREGALAEFLNRDRASRARGAAPAPLSKKELQ